MTEVDEVLFRERFGMVFGEAIGGIGAVEVSGETNIEAVRLSSACGQVEIVKDERTTV